MCCCIARLHCEARRPLDYYSRCSVMTADPNYPTFLVGGCVSFMNPDVGQENVGQNSSFVDSKRKILEDANFLRDFFSKLVQQSLILNY